jgi:P3 major capsid protein
LGTAVNAATSLPQQNLAARQLVLSSAVEMTQSIFSATVTPAATPQINIIPRNVGLIKGFWIEISALITAGGAMISLSDFNAANILSSVSFTDLQNNQRINTTGWHLAFLAAVKSHHVQGSARASDSPIKFGSNFNVISAPATLATTVQGTVIMKYWLPLAYSDQDLRGAVYGNVVNATMQLQLNINNTPSVASGDSTGALYTGSTAVINSATVNVYQVYLDQIPQGKGGPILPILDLSTIYELKYTTLVGMVPNQEFPIPYSNFRDYLSTFLVYYNGSARAAGTDVNYIALQAANFSNIFKVDPFLLAMKSRDLIGVDFPNGVYYVSHRNKPVATTQYGNMELIINPSTAGASAYAMVAYEDFALTNALSQAGSLPG